MISRITTLQDSDVQFSTITATITQHQKLGTFKEKKKLTEKTHEDDQMVNSLDRDFLNNCLKDTHITKGICE